MLKFMNTNCVTVRDFIFGNINEAETLIFLIVKWILWSTRFHGGDAIIYKITEVQLRITFDKENILDKLFNAKWNQYSIFEKQDFWITLKDFRNSHLQQKKILP